MALAGSPWFAEGVTRGESGHDGGYPDLDTGDQVELLRGVALEAAGAYGLDVAALTLVLHGFNTTFRVDTTDGRTLALRVNTNSLSTPEHVAAQQAWVHAIASETDVLVPDAVAARSGERLVIVPCAALGGSALVVVNTWLEGPDVGRCGPVEAHALGRAMATLHRQALGWTVPVGAELPVFDEPLFGDTDVIPRSELTTADSELLAEAFDRSREAVSAVSAASPAIAIHADLHGGNLKHHEGRLAVFDFDDSGVGVPAIDLAVATFYLREGRSDAESALRSGYAAVASLPDLPPVVFEGVVAARQLLLANSLFATTTAQWRGEAEEYLGTTIARLRHWLDTGRFTRDDQSSG